MDKNVDTLLQQLKDSKHDSILPQPIEKFDKNDLEGFILTSTVNLIKTSNRAIDELTKLVIQAPNFEDAEALAELVKASTAAMDTLNKILLQDKKAVVSVSIKQMDIESKKQLQTNDLNHQLLMNRDELLDKLLKKVDIIELEG